VKIPLYLGKFDRFEALSIELVWSRRIWEMLAETFKL